jgi:hypothetical protein
MGNQSVNVESLHCLEVNPSFFLVEAHMFIMHILTLAAIPPRLLFEQ